MLMPLVLLTSHPQIPVHTLRIEQATWNGDTSPTCDLCDAQDDMCALPTLAITHALTQKAHSVTHKAFRMTHFWLKAGHQHPLFKLMCRMSVS
eukprot:scaffold133793_cov18-Tisochrysis_lutea.AAC.1